jgi:hypothetical protein
MGSAHVGGSLSGQFIELCSFYARVDTQNDLLSNEDRIHGFRKSWRHLDEVFQSSGNLVEFNLQN